MIIDIIVFKKKFLTGKSRTKLLSRKNRKCFDVTADAAVEFDGANYDFQIDRLNQPYISLDNRLHFTSV